MRREAGVILDGACFFIIAITDDLIGRRTNHCSPHLPASSHHKTYVKGGTQWETR